MNWRRALPVPATTHRLNPSRAELRALEAENKRFPVERLVEIPREDWPAFAVTAKHVRVLKCRDFLVQVFEEADGVLRMSVQRTAFDPGTGRWKDGIGWDDLQHLKRLAGYGERVAVEVYPPDAEVVDVANIRHLWLLAEAPTFMWRRA